MSETRFEEVYKVLNAAQKEAVDTIEGPVMVVAGPGTGKTTILTLRIANILKRTDIPPNGILAITYTDAGVKAMRTKLQQFIGTRAHEVGIYTFHGFASAMMAEYPDHFLHIDRTRIITDIEQESLIRSILTESRYASLRPIGRPDTYLPAILSSISDAKRDMLSPDDVRAYAKQEAERIRSDEGSISTRGKTKGKLKAEAEAYIQKCDRTLLFADVYADYEKRKHEEELIDFSDLIISFTEVLQNDELFLRLLQERFLYILVDEHQDTNDTQNRIIGMLAEFFETPNVFIVGDEKQAIYRFQGASVENFLLLQKQWPDMKTLFLETNYRSHQTILDAAFSVIEHNYEGDEYKDLRIQLTAGSDEVERPIDVVTGGNTNAMEQYLVTEIQDILVDNPEATIAVIVRRNRELERVLQVLEENGVPVSSERSVDIFTHSVGAAFFDLVTYLADPTRTDALARTLLVGLWELPLEEVTEYIRLLRSGKTIDLEKKLPGLRKIRDEFTSDSPVNFIIDACRYAGFATFAARSATHVNVWRGIIALCEAVVRDRGITQPSALLEALLEYQRSSEMKAVKVSVGAPDMALQAMTAHGSKGLEFDYVFMPYATEEAWIGRPRGASFVLPQKQVSGSDIRDTRRLFYVALTRAKKHTTVLTASEESDGKPVTPLRFISELDPKCVASVDLLRADVAVPKIDVKSSHHKSSLFITNAAKQRLTMSGLSVTALNHFLDDPKTFLIESVLQMPQALHASAEKGNAMHMAMDRVWRSEEKDPKRIGIIIQNAVEDFFNDSFLPTTEKDAIRTELTDAAPVVAEALTDHFKMKGTVFTEHWVECEFSTSIEGKEVVIPLHGKLDALIATPDDVYVFDYKTRQGMSEAAVRGETKSGTDDYFRQLAFYTLLLQDSPRWKNKKVHASLVFISPDKKGRCPILTLPVSKSDLVKLHEEITSLITYVWSGKLEGLLSEIR